MCGIVTCVGSRETISKVVEGLKKLEYRGYDSWGLASLSVDKTVKIVKKIGKISDVDTNKVVEEFGENVRVGMGHTRWATHGGIAEKNCHPHADCSGKIAVVHNGVIDNYQELRAALISSGHKFVSQTDTEVIPHLIEDIIAKEGGSFASAAVKAAGMLKGRSAFVALDANEEKIIAIRRGSPLIVGLAQEEIYISSDVSAFLDRTNKISYIDDNEAVLIDLSKDVSQIKFFNLTSNQEVIKKIIELEWKNSTTDKAGYDHFLIKEIMEQKYTISRAAEQEESKIKAIANQIMDAENVFFIGCGTAGKVCKSAGHLFSSVAGKHVTAVVASEFSNYAKYTTKSTLVMAISQSGETADVLEAIEMAKSKGARVVSLLNTSGSTMMRASDESIMVNAGIERSVASTKATTAQLTVATLLAYAAAGKFKEGRLALLNTAAAINDMLNPGYEEHVKKLANSMVRNGSAFISIIGRGANSNMAEEAAIKLQETCCIPAQGFAGGELKHGPLALIAPGTVCIVLVANDETKADTLSNAMEVRARGGYIVGVAPENNDIFDYWLKVPDMGSATSPIVNIIPVQILAYHLSVLRGINPDYPRNLAKSVTVK